MVAQVSMYITAYTCASIILFDFTYSSLAGQVMFIHMYECFKIYEFPVVFGLKNWTFISRYKNFFILANYFSL